MSENIDKLVEIAKILRSENGCPWDREQNHRSVLNDLLEECYEFFDAVDKNDAHEMKEELGDLLWQVIFHCQMADEEKKFEIDDVAKEIGEKLIRRHPHIFGNSEVKNTKEILESWEKIKQSEKGKESRKSVLDGIPKTLPSLYLAEKIQKKTARYGFDWDSVLEPLKKIEEEIKEFREAVEKNNSEEKLLEFGDILFALVNAARHFDISAEDALRAATAKFCTRFDYIEKHFNYDSDKLRGAGLQKLDELWDEAKKKESHKILQRFT
ncbi:MAG: nucleoside triphosphate pyrophosphohydrolase [Chitinispirillales bacterium]|nr:nucleoside triphosphate pyrophosphohydrolase [Chitinispirillales bacterium]